MVTSVPVPTRRARPDLVTVGIVVALVTVAAAMRVVNLDAYTGKFDEGIRAEQLLLMRAGFRPVRDIFAAQGPLSLDIFYPPFVAFGETLAAARSAVVLYSLLGLLAVAWVGRLVGGRLAGLVALALLVLSPLYLKNSRLALLEVPAMVPATLSLGAALAAQASADRRWLVASAACFALALMIKPMVVAVGLPIGVALLLRRLLRPSDLLLYALVAAAVGGGVVLLYGPEQVWQQVVSYRASARQASEWSLKENWSILRQELRDEQLPIYALALAGGLALALSRPRMGLPLALWPLASFGLLLVYSPLQFKHAAILLPPLALVVGVAAADLWSAVAPLVRAGRGGGAPAPPPTAWLLLGPLAALGVWYLTSLPAILRQDGQVMSAATENRVETYDEDVAAIAQLTGPDQFILADDPIVAFNSRRLVPPSLVDPSSYRVRSGALSGGEVVAAAERYDTRLLDLFSDGLRDLGAFGRYVDARYRAVRIWERPNGRDRALYLRDDGDFESARALLTRPLDQPARADFGGDLRLLGYKLSRDELRPGSGQSPSLTLHWEAIRPMTTDYSVLTRLVAEAGQPEVQAQRGLAGGGEGTSAWEPGRWVVRTQSLPLPGRLPPGEYRLYVALYDSKARGSPLITAGGEPGATELLLGRVRVP